MEIYSAFDMIALDLPLDNCYDDGMMEFSFSNNVGKTLIFRPCLIYISYFLC